MIIIGLVENGEWTEMGVSALNGLKTAGIECQKKVFSNQRALFDAVRGGEIQVAIGLLNEVPVEGYPGLVIAGVSERKNPAYCLVVRGTHRNDLGVMDALQGLATGAIILVRDEMEALQLKAFTEHEIVVANEPNAALLTEGLASDGCQACVLPFETFLGMGAEQKGLAAYTFNPKEFIPTAGSGVLAYLVAEDDTATRRLVGKIHHPEVSEISNIERGLKQMSGKVGKKVAAYCEKDKLGYFHVYAINENGKRIRVSSSTRFELVEKANSEMAN